MKYFSEVGFVDESFLIDNFVSLFFKCNFFFFLFFLLFDNLNVISESVLYDESVLDSLPNDSILEIDDISFEIFSFNFWMKFFSQFGFMDDFFLIGIVLITVVINGFELEFC